MGGAKIVVLGAGPAGAAVAQGLHRAGEQVQVVGEPRRFAAVEGVSSRVVEALRHAGFQRALRTLETPTQRWGTWNGVVSRANTEQLVDRQRFDQALLEDLQHQGIPVLRGRVTECRPEGRGHRIEVEDEGGVRSLHADFLVEARGRAAPGQGAARLRGVETVSLLQYWQGPSGLLQSAVQSFEQGWAWMAALPDGRRYLQLTLDVQANTLPAKRELAAYCRARLETLEAARPFLAGAVPVGEPYGRTSTPVLQGEVVGDNWIRVGDAAMAVDPLSGNGIFQALSSALQAPAVIATLLHAPQQRELAARFHRQRTEDLFHRFARIGRDFYAQEQQWPNSPFWQARRGWPDGRSTHGETTPDAVRVARMPVVAQGRIVEEEVVVTPDQPNGVWHLDGVPLAPLLTALRAAPPEARAEEVLAAQLGERRALAPRLVAWMREQGWVR